MSDQPISSFDLTPAQLRSLAEALTRGQERYTEQDLEAAAYWAKIVILDRAILEGVEQGLFNIRINGDGQPVFTANEDKKP